MVKKMSSIVFSGLLLTKVKEKHIKENITNDF
jgi:hypothetical protein